MSVLSDNYKRIIEELEANVSNPKELEFVKKKFLELSTLFIKYIDDYTNKTDEKINELEQKQEIIENRIAQVQGTVDEIENDIYVEDEEEDNDEMFDFEIVCPYCNTEFVAEISGKSEISCPECHNIIELEWNDEENSEQTDNKCAGGCSSCGGCASNQIEKNEDDEENQKDDDDM